MAISEHRVFNEDLVGPDSLVRKKIKRKRLARLIMHVHVYIFSTNPSLYSLCVLQLWQHYTWARGATKRKRL